MFYLTYMVAELRRRKGRTLLTALGLGVGVGLVVTVSALSTGLDRAQEKVLEPLTGVGTDMTVTRPLKVSSSGLTAAERQQLEQENGSARLRLSQLGDPGEKFSRTDFVAASQLSFPASQVQRIAGLDGVLDTAGALTLNAISVHGTVPKRALQPGQGGGPPRNLDFKSFSVTGVDQSKPGLAPVSPDRITSGAYLSSDPTSREAVLSDAYARRNGLGVGKTIKLGDKTYTVVGLAKAPLGGQASDVYVKLGQLQALSDRAGRVNAVQVRAKSGADVTPLSTAIPKLMAGASVTTAADLADHISGSLVDAKNLAGKLGTALTIVALVAAFLIASLLTLSSVTKRIRELGTLKALGWPQRKVVRQVTGESLLQGALGGVIGALLGIAGAAAINAVGLSLKASVAAPSAPATPGGGPGRVTAGVFGQGQVASGSTSVTLHAPVDFGLIVLAISLALLGGLIAGATGGLRAARLRPADALRHID
jgi:putative ABC transport system permease protein